MLQGGEGLWLTADLTEIAMTSYQSASNRGSVAHLIDLLPDREPATMEAWLRARPGIQIVARDCNGGYGGAVSHALPEAIQVADRWHLLENASAAFLAAVQQSMPAIRKAIGAKTLDPKLLTTAERLQYEGYRRRQQTNQWCARWPMRAFPSDVSSLRTGSAASSFAKSCAASARMCSASVRAA